MKAADRVLQGVRILIAEDDAILALDLREIFRQAGAEIVGPTATLRQTLDMIPAFSVSAALLDVNLRDGEIFPAARILQESGVGVVFYTGYADVDRLKCDWPRAQILTKPAPPQTTRCSRARGVQPGLREGVVSSENVNEISH